MRLFSFAEDYRPAYYGTVSRSSAARIHPFLFFGGFAVRTGVTSRSITASVDPTAGVTRVRPTA